MWPAYLDLSPGELKARAEQALARLADCRMCPRRCGVNRLDGRDATCRTGRFARVASYFPHFGEEDCLRGSLGSGTIFFSWCNLRCVFCQNFDVSHEGPGAEVSPEALATIMVELQASGCHNINLVTPEHVVAQVLEALPLAVARGLHLPIVYNTSGYDSIDTLRLLDGIVDIYMPDFKVWDAAAASRLLQARDYPAVARAAIVEMHRQVGDLSTDRHGIARRGLLVRHLVLPGAVGGTREIMRFLAAVSPETWVNVMAQYRPAGRVSQGRFLDLDRRVTAGEYDEAVHAALSAGLRRLDGRSHRTRAQP